MIEWRLAEGPSLTARFLYREVRTAGSEGAYDLVKRFVRSVRPRAEEHGRPRSRVPREVFQIGTPVSRRESGTGWNAVGIALRRHPQAPDDKRSRSQS